ncbi:hypothetical protein [Wenxinia marina]|uniref:Uncharacterized protein n=1 Tax=Wenxinia marina DSM 24838 TaxID=1123501 RepID=A0A0D0QCX4_9RHOB|nr:hypothetical protein [Wenxinia marina]KIQ68843.1 hypothetical protein Wenmar_02572 [Wenxinia marina DSM 24838]GGL64781.1 hypothetical protein GCM10011392_19290 [Wenxinia marina]
MRNFAFIAHVALAGCIEEETDDRPSLGPAEEAACEARGGRVSIAGLLGGEFCAERTPDAGQACSRASDCSAWCESETRTCATHADPFGCRSYLTDEGEVEAICVD